MRDDCPNCGRSKPPQYRLCFPCSEDLRASQNELVLVHVQDVTHRTDKAVRVILDDSDPFAIESRWLPLSLCELDEEECGVWVPRWLAEKEDLNAVQ